MCNTAAVAYCCRAPSGRTISGKGYEQHTSTRGNHPFRIATWLSPGDMLAMRKPKIAKIVDTYHLHKRAFRKAKRHDRLDNTASSIVLIVEC